MVKEKKVEQSILDTDLGWNRVSLTQKMLFFKDLALMLKSGLVITEALKLIYGTSHGYMKKIIAELYTAVKSGRKLSDCLAAYPHIFSGHMIGAIRSGESSGSLDTDLSNVASQLKREKLLIDKIKGALYYPVIVLIVAVIVGFLMVFYILPKISKMLVGLNVELPWTTKLVVAVSSFAQYYFWQIIVSLVLLVGIFIWFVYQTWSQPLLHKVYLFMPFVGALIKDVNLARFSLTLGTLLKSGLTITEALNLCAGGASNFYFKKALEKVKLGVDKGAKLSDQLARYPDYFPEICVRMIRVGEESGKLEETLFYLNDYYDSEIDNKTKNLSTIIEPLLLVFVGLIVLLIILSIITPLYSITRGVSR